MRLLNRTAGRLSRHRRGPLAGLAVLLLGAGLGFVASAQPWWRASGDGAAVSFNGSDVTGGLCQALAAVVVPSGARGTLQDTHRTCLDVSNEPQWSAEPAGTEPCPLH